MYIRLCIWVGVVGEELVCDREPNSDRDRHPIAVIMNYHMNLASLLSWTQLLSLSTSKLAETIAPGCMLANNGSLGISKSAPT